MKESFLLAATPNLIQERKDNQNASKSFHERGKENQSNYINGWNCSQNGGKAKQQRKCLQFFLWVPKNEQENTRVKKFKEEMKIGTGN
jgi:hypothetical protein